MKEVKCHLVEDGLETDKEIYVLLSATKASNLTDQSYKDAGTDIAQRLRVDRYQAGTIYLLMSSR